MPTTKPTTAYAIAHNRFRPTFVLLRSRYDRTPGPRTVVHLAGCTVVVHAITDHTPGRMFPTVVNLDVRTTAEARDLAVRVTQERGDEVVWCRCTHGAA